MNRLILMIIVITVFLLGSCRKQKNNLSGLWKLVIIEQKDSITGHWNEWNDGLQGYLLYDEVDNMTIHLTPKGFENFKPKSTSPVDSTYIEDLDYLSQSYNYIAKYIIDFDKNIVEHSRLSHSIPREWNKVVYRKIDFNSDTLTLTTLEDSKSPMRVKWTKN